MKPTRTLLLALLLPLAAGHADDTVRLKAGGTKTGNVTGINGQSAVLQVRTGAGFVVVPIPLDQIERIDFDETPSIKALLARTEPPSIEQLRTLWRQQKPLLPLRGSSAGDVGIALGKASLTSSDAAILGEARTALEDVRKSDWNEANRTPAFDLDLQILIAKGRTDEARKVAEDGLKSSDPVLRVIASYVLAKACIAEYKVFLADNPRWDLDPLMQPRRNQLYQQVFDYLLIPYLDYGNQPDAAARSIWEMVQFYDFNGERELAVSAAQDITAIYPATPYAKSAAEFIAKHKTPAP